MAFSPNKWFFPQPIWWRGNAEVSCDLMILNISKNRYPEGSRDWIPLNQTNRTKFEVGHAILSKELCVGKKYITSPASGRAHEFFGSMFDLPELKQDLSPRRWLHLFWSFAWKLIAAFCRAQTAVTQSQMPCFVWCCDGGVKVWKGCQGWTPSSCPAVNRTWRASFIAICLVKASFLCSLFHVCSGAAAPGMPFHIQHFDWMAETSGGLESSCRLPRRPKSSRS